MLELILHICTCYCSLQLPISGPVQGTSKRRSIVMSVVRRSLLRESSVKVNRLMYTHMLSLYLLHTHTHTMSYYHTVCKYYAHENCKVTAFNNCKHCATFAYGGYLAEDRHHWVEGNLPSSARCHLCTEKCSTTDCLSGFKCGWCGITVSLIHMHTHMHLHMHTCTSTHAHMHTHRSTLAVWTLSKRSSPSVPIVIFGT